VFLGVAEYVLFPDLKKGIDRIWAAHTKLISTTMSYLFHSGAGRVCNCVKLVALSPFVQNVLLEFDTSESSYLHSGVQNELTDSAEPLVVQPEE